jgi:molecular chaperone GrpE
MTEDLRNDARPAGGEPAPDAGTPANGPDEPMVPPDDVPAETADFAEQTAQAERLGRPAEPDYKDRWLRAEAEIQNTRRRAARDRDEAVRTSEDRILLDLIEVLDDLERALAALAPEQADAAWAQGVALTAQRLREALSRRGVAAIEAVGQPFDPTLHEALLEVPAAEGIAPGAVAQEVLRGYRRGDRALRAARVVVTKAR